jgi:hypothetical protein
MNTAFTLAEGSLNLPSLDPRFDVRHLRRSCLPLCSKKPIDTDPLSAAINGSSSPYQLFQNHMRLLKNSATQSSFLLGDDREVCYSDV